MNEEFVMRPGDRFVADECGCAFTVDSGPMHADMVKQAPRCCCGNTMRKTDAGGEMSAMSGLDAEEEVDGITDAGGRDRAADRAQSDNGAPLVMAD